MQNDLIGVGIQTEGIAGLQMKFLAEGFGKGYAAGGIDCEFADHNGTVEWVNPFLFPTLSRDRGGWPDFHLGQPPILLLTSLVITIVRPLAAMLCRNDRHLHQLRHLQNQFIAMIDPSLCVFREIWTRTECQIDNSHGDESRP